MLPFFFMVCATCPPAIIVGVGRPPDGAAARHKIATIADVIHPSHLRRYRLPQQRS